MLFFYDESGTFTHSTKINALSFVGILVIPEDSLEKIEKKYKKIRASLPQENGEVKGRLLNEAQVNSVVNMLTKNDVLFLAEFIDMGMHTEEGIEEHRKEDANNLTKNLTEAQLVRVMNLKDKLLNLPQQLYIQSIISFSIIYNAIQTSTLYYCQGRPKVLTKFEWIFDAKNKHEITKWESWLSEIIMPKLQSFTITLPFVLLSSGDYSYMGNYKYTKELPEHLKIHLNGPEKKSVLDVEKIMENSRFSSESEIGLELVDILTNATRRAFSGNLGRVGWQNIPKLMIHKNPNYISRAVLQEFKKGRLNTYTEVMHHFRHGGKNMDKKNKIPKNTFK